MPTDLPTHLQHGRQAEEIAKKYLTNRGLTLVARNYRCSMGEIDLIFREKGTVVFVEVRYRLSSSAFGGAIESVGRAKRRKLAHTAEHWLQAHRHRGGCRFDVIAISGQLKDRPQIEWIADAFNTEDI